MRSHFSFKHLGLRSKVRTFCRVSSNSKIGVPKIENERCIVFKITVVLTGVSAISRCLKESLTGKLISRPSLFNANTSITSAVEPRLTRF